jgi:hypothetical protein
MNLPIAYSSHASHARDVIAEIQRRAEIESQRRGLIMLHRRAYLNAVDAGDIHEMVSVAKELIALGVDLPRVDRPMRRADERRRDNAKDSPPQSASIVAAAAAEPVQIEFNSSDPIHFNPAAIGEPNPNSARIELLWAIQQAIWSNDRAREDELRAELDSLGLIK